MKCDHLFALLASPHFLCLNSRLLRCAQTALAFHEEFHAWLAQIGTDIEASETRGLDAIVASQAGSAAVAHLLAQAQAKARTGEGRTQQRRHTI